MVVMVTIQTDKHSEFVCDAMNPSSLDDELTEQGLFIDDVYQLHILDPVVADQTNNLKKECDHFLTSNNSFQIY